MASEEHLFAGSGAAFVLEQFQLCSDHPSCPQPTALPAPHLLQGSVKAQSVPLANGWLSTRWNLSSGTNSGI